jgi:ABC-type multidrug transport system ATPase subunit
LRGRVNHFSGSIYINGVQETIHKYKTISGFVPQDDVMITNLSVKQNLLHSARTRLPASWSQEKIFQVVDETLSVLKLTHIQNSIVGNELQRGISGGERKRVNIGMELVALPSVLFLDEPTTGLDSTTAQELVELLKSITGRGITIVAVLHQPR